MARIIATLLFAVGIGLAGLLKVVHVPTLFVIAVLLSAILIALLTYGLHLPFSGLAGIPGFAFVFSQLIGHNPPGATITLITASCCIAGILLEHLARSASQPKGEDIYTNETA
jgi:hypothetical protein